MPTYKFKEIAVVPTSKEFVDITLSRTQRKTPTVIRHGFKISRIRSFYMRKVKYTQEAYHERLSTIIEEFPRLDDIHPFYSDLVNVLYSKDHYKLALGQLNMARRLIDNVGKDYVRLLKFGDSLYRCKQLKRAALGRMCTIMKKLGTALSYLEEVRQHLSRLPSIEPNTRTLLITGFPNVGKSSFINKVSRANVDVQPYPFTTKSLFVGHMDYRYMPWQVIDTPGILDKPLEERGTIEMQAITALAHLHSTVLFFIDISGQSGHSIKDQLSLFQSIKPLFANKPLLIVANKTDLKPLSEISSEDQELLAQVAKERNTMVLPMSNLTEEGIAKVKKTACDLLLEVRYERKSKSARMSEVMDRIHVAQPTPRDDRKRPTAIPEAVKARRKVKKAEAAAAEDGAPTKLRGKGKTGKLASKGKDVKSQPDAMETEPTAASTLPPRKKTEKELELEQGGPGIYNIDLRKYYKLDDPDWNGDVQPEFMDGMNVSDWIDPDIAERLADLEAEEEAQLAEYDAQKQKMAGEEDSEEEEERKALAAQIKSKQAVIKAEAGLKKTNNKPQVPRKFKTKTLADADVELSARGLDTTKMRERSRSRNAKRRRDSDAEEAPSAAPRGRSASRGRSQSAAPKERSRVRSVTPGDGFRNVKHKAAAETLARKETRKLARNARKGEADRHVFDEKPKHLFSGKRGMGKTDRR
jgi:nucleolar GTP-binding protein